MSGSALNPAIRTPGPMELMATGLQARIQSVFTPKRFTFEFVPARMTLKQWDRLAGVAPFVGLGWKGIPVRSEFESTFQAEAQWTVYIVTKNASGVQGNYLGDAQGAGLLRLVESAVSLLNGFTIPLVGPCFVAGAGNLWVDGWEAQGCALVGVDIQVGLSIEATDTLDFGDVPLLTETVTTWTEPSGDVLIVDTDTNVQSE